MDDIQKKADDKAWDKKVDCWIAETSRKIEQAASGEALAALHGLHVPPDDELVYEVDETSESDDQNTLRDKIIRRLIQIEDSISQNYHVADDVKRKWIARLRKCDESDTNSVTSLRELREEIDRWGEIDPQSELSMVYVAIGAVATMAEIYRRRFCSP